MNLALHIASYWLLLSPIAVLVYVLLFRKLGWRFRVRGE